VLPTAPNNMTRYSDTHNSKVTPVLMPSQKEGRTDEATSADAARSPRLSSPNAKQIPTETRPAPVNQKEAVWFQNQMKGVAGRRFWLSLMVGIPALIALGYSGYLFGIWFNKSNVAGCSGSIFDCDSVLSSKWSGWFGIPVSGLAMMNYLLLISALVAAQFSDVQRRELMWKVVIFCGLSAFCAAIWFIMVQWLILTHWCKYCLIAHCCGLVIGSIFLIVRPLGSAVNMRMGTLALAGLAVLAVGQTFSQEAEKHQFETYDSPAEGQLDSQDNLPAGEGVEDFIFDAPDIFEAPDMGALLNRSSHFVRSINVPQVVHQFSSFYATTGLLTYQDAQQQEESGQQESAQEKEVPAPPKERRLAEMRGGQIKLEINQWPRCGNENSEYVLIEMFDYNCRHCRTTHQAVKAAKEQMGDKLTVIALPVPLNTRCNNQVAQTMPQFAESCDLANLAVAVWRTDPEKFSEFHNFMFTGANAPNFATAKKQAEALVDATKLNEILNTNLPKAYIEKHVQLYRSAGGGTIPKLMFKSTAIVGEYSSTSGLLDVIRNHGQVTVVPAN